MAASATIVPMAHERKVENLRDFMVNLAKSRGLLLPETKFFEQKFVDLCLSRVPDHPTYSAMIFVAITELKEKGGSREEAISEFIKSKYKYLPFAHTSLLSHHLAKLVEKKEILCDYNNYCYTLPGDKEKSDASTDAERKSSVIKGRRSDQRMANEVIPHQNEEERVLVLKSGDHKVDHKSGKELSLTESRTSSKRKACGGINVVEVRHTEDNGVNACLRDSTVETLREEPEVAVEYSETEGRAEANIDGGELCEVVVQDWQNDVLMVESGKEEENPMGIISKLRKAKLPRTSNTMKEASVEVKSKAYKTLWECQTETCGNIIALEKMLKQCKEKDQLNTAVSEIDDVSRLPLSMENCKELRKIAQKIESQLSEIIDSFDEAVVPSDETRGSEIEGISKGLFKEDPMIKTPCENNGSGKPSKQHEQKEREIDSQKKPRAKKTKTRVKRLRDIGTRVLRKSPRMHKPT
uniref:H15 domain-containing protein n=1 Tax=Noccaea caerulescens TaxID=107243 RepID=A0A1J3FLP2_NOCCA